MKELVAAKGRLRRSRKLLRLLRVQRFRRGLLFGVAAQVEHVDVPLGERVRSVVDVGAHHGQFALLAAERFPGALIFCVEPYPLSQRRLTVLQRVMPEMRIVPYAAAASAGATTLVVSAKSDSSSLLPITQRYVDAFPGTQRAGSVVVESKRLDELFEVSELPRPILLKIDVQGGELSVLQGATRLLSAVDTVFVECSFVELYEDQALIADVVCFLRPEFVLSGIFSVVRDHRGECLQADLLFRRRRGPQ